MLKEAAYTTDDAVQWTSVLPVEESVFGSIQFARITQQHQGYQARLYVLKDRASLIAYPFFVRPIRPLFVGQEIFGDLSDTVSPDFTGPLAQGASVRSLGMEFPARFCAYSRNHGVVAEFIHLHPWKAFTVALHGRGLQFDREVVYVDLTLPEEHLWRAAFTHACRKNINRSRQEHVRVFEAQTIGDVGEFHRLYVQTMKGRNALQRYYFSLDYFTSIFEQLEGSARFALAEYRNQVVAGTLYLHDRDDVYSYLGGSDVNFQQVRPTNAIVHDTVLWGKRQGKKRLILGGGYCPNDGILRFKASFSPERAKFYVYKCVHLPEKYAAVCRSWSSLYGRDLQTADYFPPYRFVPGSEHQDSCCAAPAGALSLVSQSSQESLR